MRERFLTFKFEICPEISLIVVDHPNENYVGFKTLSSKWMMVMESCNKLELKKYTEISRADQKPNAKMIDLRT